MSPFETITTEILPSGVALLTLNRPEKRNALSILMRREISSCLSAWKEDPGVGAVVVGGVGPVFCAGFDLDEFREPSLFPQILESSSRYHRDVWYFPKPVIAAVNGLAVGGGCEIIEAVHLAVASEEATFAKPEINVGIPPTFGGTQRLPRLAGRKRALEYLLTGDAFSAQRAYEFGLVNRIVPHARVLSEALGLAERILRHSPLTAARIISAVSRGLNASIAEGLAIESEQFARMVPTHDLAEALDAWLNRRKPVYQGN